MKRLFLSLACFLAACGGMTTSDVPSPSPSPSSSSSSDSDDHACTGIGCTDGLHVTLDAPSGWKPGSYVFTVTADGATQTCEGTLPLPACGTAGLRCTGSVAQIGESGCALPAASHAFADLMVMSGPARIEVRITRDGVTLADEVLSPSYVTSQPNGAGCAPICRQATGKVTLAEP